MLATKLTEVRIQNDPISSIWLQTRHRCPYYPALCGAGLSSNMNIDNTMIMSLIGAFLLFLLFFLIICRPWRFFFHPFSSHRSSSSITATQTDDIEQPLISESNSFDLTRVNIQEITDHANEGDSLILEVHSNRVDIPEVDPTVKDTSSLNRTLEDTKHVNGNTISNLSSLGGKRKNLYSVKNISKTLKVFGSNLNLKVISGPSCGLCCSRESTDTSVLPVTIGRVPPSHVLINDSEISGKHAQINWNRYKSKWEMVDMGSLNGTFLNSQIIQNSAPSSRQWSAPVELENGDIITLGTSSKLSVQISENTRHKTISGVGTVSDPMAVRRGGKQLPMEDVCYSQCPLPGAQQFAVFGIFDGHGGDAAAKTASKMLPENVVEILSITENRESVVSSCSATDVLRDSFHLTEAAMNHQYEGCTATILLVWIDHNEEIYAQCANVGDSACVINVSEQLITMTEDHRVTGIPERTRFSQMGMPMKDGETRLCGCINLSRMLGDKFLKEQDSRFSSEPYVSQVVHIPKECTSAFALLASDGLWDVITVKKAVQFILQIKDRYSSVDENYAEIMAKQVLEEARRLRTKDNTSVIFLDFDSVRINLCNIHS